MSYADTIREILAGHYAPESREFRAAYNQARHESRGFDPAVVECRESGAAGERGVWQIIPRFHPGVDPCDLGAATAYRCAQTDRIQRETGNLRAAIAAWNCGEGTVKNALARSSYLWESLIPTLTQTYLRVVMEGALLNLAPLPVATASDMQEGVLTPPLGIRLPFRGSVSQEYGWSRFALDGGYGGRIHSGIDVGGIAEGTLVCAVLPGVVSWMGWNPSPTAGYGFSVVVEVAGGLFLSYNHLAGPAVCVGNRVKEGDVLGYAGTTGRSTGVHTHLELRTATDETLDPTPYLLVPRPEPEPDPDPEPDPGPKPEPGPEPEPEVSDVERLLRALRDGITEQAGELELRGAQLQEHGAALLIQAANLRALTERTRY